MSAYKEYITEKMGVISRVNQECDEFRISQITNELLDDISKDPAEPYEVYNQILDKTICIKYQPTHNSKIGGITKNGCEIIIYEYYNNENHLKLKYFIVHELVHVLQGIFEKEIEHSLGDDIQYKLLNPYINLFLHNENSDSEDFLVTLYFITISEINAWAHNAYEKAFSYKLKYPDWGNSQIMKKVLDNLGMSQQYLNEAIYNIKNVFGSYNIVLCILIGHFPEISKVKHQQFFGKEVFKLDSVKNLKNDILKLIKELTNVDDKIVDDKIIKFIKYTIIPKNIHALYGDFNIITNSFIEHFKYWFSKLQKKLGKAIQLGIDDATENFKNLS